MKDPSASPAPLESHLPRFFVERLLGTRDDAPPLERSESGALLFLDLSGFTRLTESFANRGQQGAEDLSTALNRYFGRFIDLVTEAGGDIIEFAGDAALVLWIAPNESMMAEVTCAAAHAGLVLQRELDGFEPVQGVRLRARAAVAAGRASILQLGGAAGRRECLVTGELLTQLVRLDAVTRAGATLVSSEAWRLIEAHAKSRQTGDGARALETVDEPRGFGTPAPPPSAHPALSKLLEVQLPRHVVDRVLAGHRDWLAEFRTVSVLFAGFGEVSSDNDLATLHAAVSTMQTVTDSHGGSIYQCLADEKGMTFVAAFGLPPRAHADDAVRATRAAMEISRELADLDVKHGVGVTTGRVFSGVFGTSRRSNYALRGATINLAARLMKMTADGILCDEPTARAAGSKIAFEVLPPVRVRGREDLVTVTRPTGTTSHETASTGTMIGRQEELERLTRRVDDAVLGRGSVVSLEGPAGIGKSRMLVDLTEAAAKKGVEVSSTAADAIETATAYFAWRRPLERLLSRGEGSTDPPHLCAELADRVRDSPNLIARAPVLNAVLPLGLRDTDVTRQMDGPSRADSLEDVVVHLLAGAAAERPQLLVIDDVHWLDSASAALVRGVIRRVPAVMIVLASRPEDDTTPEDVRALLASGERVRLETLTRDEVDRLVAQRLGARRVAAVVGEFVHERAEGHPLFSQELALALWERGQVAIEDGEVRATADSLEAAGLPESLEGIINERIDRLTPSQQLTLKAASVIGPIFSAAVLGDVHPVAEDRKDLGELLRQLDGAEVIRRVAGGTESYAFNHVTIREVAYASMLPSQRRALHRDVAEWYEAHHDDLSRWHPLLGYHFSAAKMTAKAIEHLELAAEQALASFSNREAAQFVSQAIDLTERESAPIDRKRRARWKRILGEAHVKLADLSVAKKHLLDSLELAGAPFPKSNATTTTQLVRQFVLQAAHRIKPSEIEGDAPEQELTAGTYHLLAEVCFFSHDLLGLLYSTFTSLNHAERAGAVREMVYGYGSVAHVASMFGMRDLGRRYRERSLALAEEKASLPTIAFAHQIAATMGNCVGDWQDVQTSCERSVDLFARLGDRFRWESCKSIHGYKHFAVGDLAEARTVWNEAFESANPDGAVQVLMWTRAGRVLTALADDAEPESSDIEGISALLGRDIAPAERTLGLGALAQARLRLGDRDRAARDATDALELMTETAPATSYTLWSIAGVTEVLVDAWERRPGDVILGENVKRMTRVLSTFARAIPIARPYAELAGAEAAWLAGRHRVARRRLRAAADAAVVLQMPLARATIDRVARKRSEA